MRHHWTKCIPLILARMLPLAACDDNEMAGPEDSTATLSVYLTDAPRDLGRVWVELIGLTAQGGEGGPVELLSGPTGLILLTDLVGTIQLLQVNTLFNPTTISQLRLVIGDAVLEAEDETVYVKGDPDLPEVLGEVTVTGELQCPSCSQSGIKVKVPNDEMEIEGGEAALVLDFEVAQSFGHKAGKSGKWIMHPVIHGTLVENVDLMNSITGTIVRAGTVNEDGTTFQIGFLPTGSFTMGFVEVIPLVDYDLTFTATVAPGQVTVPGPEVTGVAYTITSALCQPVG